MGYRESSCETLVSAMRILSQDIQSEDGVANAAIAEAADRLERFYEALVKIRDHKGYGYERSVAQKALLPKEE